jgi:tripartite-type tricarboxylate transporter receptor subunit TctC
MISKRHFLKSAGLSGLALFAARPAFAALTDYPSHPVRWVVPYTAGGATDVLSRLICQRLSERLGQSFVVENKPGAGSNIGTQAVIAAPPDGYTLLLTSTANAINASFDPTLPFDFAKGIAPVAGVARIPLVLVVNNDLPVKSVADFIAYAKANPGKLSIASSGIGTSLHLSGELFKAQAGVAFIHVPYRGSAPGLTDVMSGQIQGMFDNVTSSFELVKAGKLRALGVTTTRPAHSTASVHRTRRRARSSTSSTRRSMRRSPIPRSSSALPSSAPSRFPATPPNSARCSRPRPSAGARWWNCRG